MHLLVAFIGIVISAVTIYSFLTAQFGSVATGKPDGSGRTPVIIVNEMRRSLPMGSCGSVCSGGYSDCRERAEEKFRQNKFSEAIELFEEAISYDPDDMRAVLGLGKSYVAIHRYDEAIPHLCKVRNDCESYRESEEADGSEDDTANGAYATNLLAISFLPEQALTALDHEARVELEEALLRRKQRRFGHDNVTRPFKNDRHFRVMNAAVALARDCHIQSRSDELSALYRLASENTRTLPAEVINHCLYKGTSERQWDHFAESLLQSMVPSEEEWYMERMMSLVSEMPQATEKFAATNHYYGKVCKSELKFSALSEAYQFMSLSPFNTSRDFADCAYDYGMQCYKDGTDEKQTRDLFLEALRVYQKCGTAKDIADVNYNLGILSYRSSDFHEAKSYFKSAIDNYSGCLADKSDAVYNWALLATDYDYEPEGNDKEYLSHLHSTTSTPQLTSLIGLYEYKQGNYEEALRLLRIAKAFYTPDLPPTMLHGASNSTTSGDSSASCRMTTRQVLDRLFAREGRITDCIYSRFAYYADSDEKILPFGFSTTKLMKNSRPEFSGLVSKLYAAALQKTGRTEELAAFFRFGALRDAQSISPEERYKRFLRGSLEAAWFCPAHESIENIVVHARIRNDGSLQLREIHVEKCSDSVLKSITEEALPWAQVPVSPPAELAGREVIIVFNANKTAASNCMPGRMPIAARPGGRTGEW